MQSKKRIALLLSAMLAMQCVAGLAEAPAATQEPVIATEEPAAAAPAESAPAISNNTVLAVVNGLEIKLSDVTPWVTRLAQQISSNYGMDVTSDPEAVDMINRMGMQYAVQYAVISTQAVAQGMSLTEAERAELEAENNAQWDDAINNYLLYYENLPEDATDEQRAAATERAVAYYETQGFTRENTLKSMVDDAVNEKLYEASVGDVKVSDEDVKATFEEYVAADESYYKDNIGTYEYMTQYYGQKAYYMPEGYRGVTHILLNADEELLKAYNDLLAKLEAQKNAEANPTATEQPEQPATEEEPVTQEQVDNARAAVIASIQPTIDEITAKLNDGASFDSLIDAYNTDPGMQDPANRQNGYAVHKDSIIWDPAFTEGAMSIAEVGQVSEPVVSSFGVHILYYLRDIPSGAVEMTDEIAAEIRTALEENAGSDAFEQKILEWLKVADITYTDDAADYKPLEADPLAGAPVLEGALEEAAEQTAEPAAQ